MHPGLCPRLHSSPRSNLAAPMAPAAAGAPRAPEPPATRRLDPAAGPELPSPPRALLCLAPPPLSLLPPVLLSLRFFLFSLSHTSLCSLRWTGNRRQEPPWPFRTKLELRHRATSSPAAWIPGNRAALTGLSLRRLVPRRSGPRHHMLDRARQPPRLHRAASDARARSLCSRAREPCIKPPAAAAFVCSRSARPAQRPTDRAGRSR